MSTVWISTDLFDPGLPYPYCRFYGNNKVKHLGTRDTPMGEVHDFQCGGCKLFSSLKKEERTQ